MDGRRRNAAEASSAHAALATHAPAIAEPDPDEEARAALERPHGAHCSLPLAEE